MPATLTCPHCRHTMPRPEEAEPSRKVQWLYFLLCCCMSCITMTPSIYCFDSLTTKHTCPSCRKLFDINGHEDDRTSECAKRK